MTEHVTSSQITEPEDEMAEPPIKPVYLTDHQRAMLECLRSNDIVSLLELVESAEKKNAVNPNSSRIIKNCNWQAVAVFLVMQPERLALESLLDMTLPQRSINATTAGLQHTNQTARNLLRRPGNPDQWKGKKDPVIYVNALAGRDGCGLSCAEFDEFLTAMEVGAKMRSDDDGRFEKHGRSLIRGIVELHYKFQNSQFYETLGRDASKKDKALQILQDRVRHFVKYNRAILADARAKGFDHIMLKFEVGWAAKGYSRCQDHKNLAPRGSSPNLMRLAFLVLGNLFPDRGFRFHQFVLFDIGRDIQADVGESVGSQLCCSYDTYGGFNAAQAGISISSAKEMDYRDWMAVFEDQTRRHCFDNVKPNLERYTAHYKGMFSGADRTLQGAKLNALLDLDEEDGKYLDTTCTIKTAELASVMAQMDENSAGLQMALDERKQREHELMELEEAFAEVADALGLDD
ncbi:hypothetical protein PRZ48_011339 [Zasmidium cellare]|uniref:Uncharacterized protein n=1 Tax=Zasmidium cellare TaxID=395010 RepID=A0ABR0E6A6_ZASCE|nr:hypothetical protein PRZ48_011339 [Zasmidium cellare]